MQPQELGLAFCEDGIRYFTDWEKGRSKKQGPYIVLILPTGKKTKIFQKYSKKLQRVVEPEEFIKRYPKGKEPDATEP